MTYKQVLISKINPDAILPADIYLCLNGKHIKFKNSGESLGTEKFNMFMEKGINYLYILEKDWEKFNTWINDKAAQEIEAFVNQAGEANRTTIIEAKKLEEVVYEVFADESLDLEKIDKLQDNVHHFVDQMKNNPDYAKALKVLTGRSNSIASHSIAVANLSIYIAMSIATSHLFDLENIYLASIFHDYGKLKIPEQVLSNPQHVDYLEAINSHPNNSVSIIRKSEGVPEQVIKMIQEHHEYWDGTGFPRAISGRDLYKNSPILSLANELECFLTDNKEFDETQRFNNAIKMVKDGESKKWPPHFYPRIVEALQFGFFSQRGLE